MSQVTFVVNYMADLYIKLKYELQSLMPYEASERWMAKANESYIAILNKIQRLNLTSESNGVFFSAKMSPSYKVHSKNC